MCLPLVLLHNFLFPISYSLFRPLPTSSCLSSAKCSFLNAVSGSCSQGLTRPSLIFKKQHFFCVAYNIRSSTQRLLGNNINRNDRALFQIFQIFHIFQIFQIDWNSGTPEIKNTKYATSTQYRAFLYFFFFCAQSAQRVRKMGSTGAPHNVVRKYCLFFWLMFIRDARQFIVVVRGPYLLW